MTNLALSSALPAPYEAPNRRRHIEIVSSRSQRRARPRTVYALVTVAGLFVILMAQLLLSILLSNGAYQITALQGQQTELGRDAQTLTEKLDVLKSPQNLSARAEALGMVMSTAPAVYLRLSDGAVIGTPVAASAAEGSVMGADGAFVTNALLPPMIPGDSAVSTETDGAPDGTADAGSVMSTPGVLPSPVTH